MKFPYIKEKVIYHWHAMLTLIHLLRNIGLSEKEAIIYCVNFQIGANPASVIAKKSELNRCTTYVILESLINKGLVTQVDKNKIQYFAAKEPKYLLTYINEKRRYLAYFRDEISASLSKFEELKKGPLVQRAFLQL
jgi:sugar-specific transcriptional regulator TrmB